MAANGNVSILVSGVRELDASAIRCIPLGGSLGDDTTDTGFLGSNLVGSFVLVLVGTVGVHFLYVYDLGFNTLISI